MRHVVRDLLTTDAAIEKLGRRGISEAEAKQLTDNPQLVVRNAGRERPGALYARWMLIGLTDGGRALTLVIEETVDPSKWLIVTGWRSDDRERRMLRR
jgi:uncharacterized DUF497 family protein